MASQSPSHEKHHRSTKRVVLDLILIVGIPTILIYVVSLVWK
ncbi:MAG: hypothetical protein ACE15D_00855 [Candidatus Eisenbacteria bacterium]|nr:hypothetical protein [Candidatus Eisenbacteria bacterium]